MIKSAIRLITLFLPLILQSNICVAVNENISSAQTSNFTYHTAIVPGGNGPLQQLTLSEEIYQQSSRSDLRSLSVLDVTGVKLPFEITTTDRQSTLQSSDLLIYPIHEKIYLADQTDKLLFRYNQNNQLREISSNSKGVNKKEVVGYLVDLGENFAADNSRLVFNLSNTLETRFLRFDLDQSNNLKNWTLVSRGEVLAQLSHNGISTQHNKISISNIRSRYLRIKLLDLPPAFTIDSVVQEYSTKQERSLSWGKFKNAVYDPEEKAYITNIAASIGYTKMKFILPKSLSILKGALYTRSSNETRWFKRNGFSLFQVQDGEKIISNDTVDINYFRANQIKIQIDYPERQIMPEALRISFAWFPQELTFIASGKPPYEIIVSDSTFKQWSNTKQQLLSDIKSQLSSPMEQAVLGKTRRVEMAIADESKTDWEKIGLWLILLVGVIFMAWMAKRLLKQLA